MLCFMAYLNREATPIVVDRGCGKGRRTWWYIQTALLYGYEVKFAEPTSPWWKKIKKAIKRWDGYTTLGNNKEIHAWVDFLYEKQKLTHGVSKKCLRKSLLRYDSDLTIEDLIGDHDV